MPEEGSGTAQVSKSEVTGPSISISSGNDGKVVCEVTFQGPDGVDLTALLRSVATLLRASFAANIDAGGRPAFAPLKASTLRQKQLMGYPLTPLIRSRLLRNSLAQSNTTGNVNRVSQGTASVRIGTHVPYAAVHQEGGGRGIPARPFMVVQKQDETAIKGLVALFNQKLGTQQQAKEKQTEAAGKGARAAGEMMEEAAEGMAE